MADNTSSGGPIRPEIIDTTATVVARKRPRKARRKRAGVEVPSPSLQWVRVRERAVLDMEHLAPPSGDERSVEVATLVPEGANWRSYAWCPGFYGQGFIPVMLEASSVVAVTRIRWVRRRRWFGWREQRVCWYWSLRSIDHQAASLWGPFGALDGLKRLRWPSS